MSNIVQYSMMVMRPYTPHRTTNDLTTGGLGPPSIILTGLALKLLLVLPASLMPALMIERPRTWNMLHPSFRAWRE
jgi:hypothetical protein